MTRHLRILLEQAKDFLDSDDCIFVAGDPGTGKTSMGEILHEGSRRVNRPLHKYECKRLENADRAVQSAEAVKLCGVYDAAQGATLLIDDIDYMPKTLQARFCEHLKGRERSVRILTTASHFPSRLIADEKNHAALIDELSREILTLRPLQLLTSQIAVIADEIAQNVTAGWGHGKVCFEPQAMELLETYDWPGNLVEFESLLRSTLASGSSLRLSVDDIPFWFKARHFHRMDGGTVALEQLAS